MENNNLQKKEIKLIVITYVIRHVPTVVTQDLKQNKIMKCTGYIKNKATLKYSLKIYFSIS